MLHGKSITLIAAMARNRAIGKDGEMPWHLPGELKHFKETTMGKPIVMGRKTWESIGRALPGRQNIVVTRNPGYQAPGCELARSLDEAVHAARGEEVMIIGGGQLYRQSITWADRMILTEVDCEPGADTWFPEWREGDWRKLSERSVAADDRNRWSYTVAEWIRKKDSGENAPEPGTGRGLQGGGR